MFRSIFRRFVFSGCRNRRFISFDSHSVPPVIKSFVGGKYIDSTSGSLLDVVNPATGEILTRMEVAGQAEVDLAVQAAAEAQKAWGCLSGMERSRVLRKASDRLTEMNDVLAKVEALDTGRPIAETIMVDIVSARDAIEYLCNVATTMNGEYVQLPDGSFGYTRREPLGVTGGIGAWNYPIQSAGWKSAPALACGNSMVFKPSEETPLTALLLAEVFQESGLPDGLFNVVLGAGSTGALLSSHSDIAKISFTGSVNTGKKVYQSAASTLKKVTMELGGKSPLIVFSDADLPNAVSAAMMANFYSNGEVCSNGTRVFVHRDIHAKFVASLVERVKKLKLGDPMDENTEVGPMISEAHMMKVLRYIEQGKSEGAQLLCGGDRTDNSNGFFLTPAVFDNCTDDMSIVKEEIFGMVCSVLVFDTEEEVVGRANATPFGLSAGVFTQDVARAHRVVGQLQAGTTWINNYNLAPIELPWGGVKQSGVGRENGTQCVHEWTATKSVYVEQNDVWCPYA